jgi:hypothetical protein
MLSNTHRQLVPVHTQGGGDCAFHAVLGKKNAQGMYVCADIEARRQEVAEKIQTCSSASEIFPSVKEGIEELVRAQQSERVAIELDSQSYPRLSELRKKYNKNDEQFGDLSHQDILKEYADLIATPGIWLLPCELSIIAYACQKTIVYFHDNLQNPQSTFNPEQADARHVYFNGKDHYEAMEVQDRPVYMQQSIIQGDNTHNTLTGSVYHPYDKDGLTRAMHGNIYQLKLLMLFLHQGYKKKYQFFLATEMKAAEKFDDLAFIYRKPGEGEKTIRYIQAKHKQDDNAVISDTDLLSRDNKGEFALAKYFISYQRIRKKHNTQYAQLGEFCIFTNIGFDVDATRDGKRALKLLQAFESVKETDPILDTNTSAAKKYKFKKEFPGKKHLYDTIKQHGDEMGQLAEALADCMKEPERKVDKRKTYFNNAELYAFLTQHNIIDDSTRRVTEDFQTAHNLSPEAEDFKALYDQAATGKSTINNIQDKDIDRFLKHLVFAVNQPNEVKLGEIIAAKLGEAFNLIDSDFIYSDLLRATLDWMKQKNGQQLDHAETGSFFKQMEEKISRLVLIGPTMAYQNKLKEFGIAFNPLKDLTTFLSSQNQLMLYKVSGEVFLSGIQIYQTLFANRYPQDDAYIFVSLNKALRLDKHLLSAFQSAKSQLLVLACPQGIKTEDEKACIATLLGMLAESKKKIILILPQNAAEIDHHILKENAHDAIEASNGFTALTPSSQQKLRDKSIDFQGKATRLAELGLDLNTLIDAEILYALCTQENLSIGQIPDPIPTTYINRKVKAPTYIVDAKCLKEDTPVFVIAGIDETQFKQLASPSSFPLRFRVPEDDVERFKEICAQHSNIPIHHLNWANQQLIWQQSRGSLRHLRAYINTDEKYSEAITLDNQYAVLAAEPGMGKSTFITHWANQLKEKDPQCWVVVIRLLDITKNLKTMALKDNTDITQLLLTDPTPLAQKMFSAYLHSPNKVAILFDGFDEIEPAEREKIIQLLCCLKETAVKQIIVTTRKEHQDVLEDTLSVFAHDLVPFTKDEAQRYIHKIWLSQVDPSKLTDAKSAAVNDYIAGLINALQRSIKDKKEEFITIPLQAALLATAFLEDFQQYYDEESRQIWPLPNSLTLSELYPRFVQAKYAILIQDKLKYNQLDTRPEIEAVLTNRLNQYHERLAFELIFPSLPLSKKVVMPTEIQSLVIRTGMITQFINGKPQFIHRTFAEYFAALFLMRKFLTNPENPLYAPLHSPLIQQIFKASYAVVRDFISTMVKTPQYAHLSVNWDQLCKKNLLPNRNKKLIIEKPEVVSVSPAILQRAEDTWFGCLPDSKAVGQYCQAFLKNNNIEQIESSLDFLQRFMNYAYRINGVHHLGYALQTLILHYMQRCEDEKRPFKQSLIQAFENEKDYEDKYYLPLGLLAVTKAIDNFQKRKQYSITADQVATLLNFNDFAEGRKNPTKDGRITEWVRFLLLLQAFWLDNNPKLNAGINQQIKQAIDTAYVNKGKQKIKQYIDKADADKGLFWLKSHGINCVTTYKALTPAMATAFQKPLPTGQITGIETDYAAKIWRHLLPLLDQMDVNSTNRVNKAALLKMCVDFMQFSLKNEVSWSFTPTLAGLNNLLKYTETVLNGPLNEVLLDIGVSLLYQLNQTGLQILDISDDCLYVLDPKSEFGYELILHHKKSIQGLLLAKAQRSEETFKQKCQKVLKNLAPGKPPTINRRHSQPDVRKGYK